MAVSSRLRARPICFTAARVGHGRLGAAAVVTNRPRVGARAARPHPDAAGLVDRGDAAAARADFRDVYGRHLHRVAGALDHALPQHGTAANLGFAAHAERKIFDDGRLGGRAAHVEHDHVAHAGVGGQALSAQHPGSRP